MESWFRNVAAITHGSMGGKETPHNLWPMRGDVKQAKGPMSQEDYVRLQQLMNKVKASV